MLNNKVILITNDDGIQNIGLYLLTKEAYKYTKNIYVVAPQTEQSAVSHKLSIRSGVTYKECEPLYEDVKTYSVDGTPADCISFAVVKLGIKPDIVLSGVNNGLNLGNDILYSGTVAACFEACLCGIKSIAFSTERGEQEAIKHFDYILEVIQNDPKLKDRKILNVNIPLEIKGYKVTHQGLNPFDTYFELIDGRYYSVGKPLGKNIQQSSDTDIICYHDGYISITPLTIDRTEW